MFIQLYQIVGLDRPERDNDTGGSAATAISSIRVIVELDIESASSTACLSW